MLNILLVAAGLATVDPFELVQQYDEAATMCSENSASRYPKYFSPQMACDARNQFATELQASSYCNPWGSGNHFWRKGLSKEFGYCKEERQ